MRNKLLCLLIGLSLITIPLLAQDDAYSNYERRSVTSRIARISYIEGDAKLNTQFAQINSRILEGDELYTQQGRVEVYLDGGFLRLNHHTKVVFAGIGEESTLVDVRYGEVYIQSERTIDIQTPHENFSLQGVYRIEVDRYDTKKLRNPMYDDNFDKWSYWREREAEREIYYAEEYEEEEEPYIRRADTYVGGIGWDSWYPHWGWSPYWYWNDWYYGWHSYWRWTSWYYGWHPYWSWTNWYWNSYYPYYSNYYYRSNYYYGSSYDYYRPNQRYTVRKDQLKRRTPVTPQGVKRIGSTTGTATTTTKGKQPTRVSKSKGIKSTPSRGTVRRTVPTKSGTIKKKKISSSRLGSIGRIYPSRIQTRIKTSTKKNRYSTYSRSLNTGSSYRSPRISSRSYTSRSYSRPSSSRSISKSSSSRSYSGSSARSSSGSSRSVSSGGKVRKK